MQQKVVLDKFILVFYFYIINSFKGINYNDEVAIKE